MNPKSHLVLGIMSGTSLDAVDYALCDISARDIRLRELWTARFPRALQARLHEAARGETLSWELAQLHHDLGRFYAAHARDSRLRQQPALVGLHGQTIFHQPSPPSPATFQLGEPAYLAETLRVPVISNFRVADLAAGGQGAPLATLFHLRVFGRRGRHICVNNLGGISNVTSIDSSCGREPKLLSFDTGPANVLLDLAMREHSGGRLHFDRDGRRAARGHVHEPVLHRWLRHSYFSAPPPKSTGRELFGEPFFHDALRQMRRAKLSESDTLATLTAFTARALALNYRLHLATAPDSVILSGGGAANSTLRDTITSELKKLNPRVTVQTSAQLGWPVQSIEPAAFALLAWMRMRKKPGNLPATTGANRAAMLGQITEA